MNINIEELLGLSKLDIEGGNLPEKETLKLQLEKLIEKLELPESLDIVSPLDIKNAMTLREDETEPSLSREELLLNAPQKQAGCFVVPKTV